MNIDVQPVYLRPISIVGIATELPSGSYADHNLDHKEFNDFLLQGREAYEEIPSERFNVQSWHGHAAGQVITRRGSFLKDIDMFDPVEFGISAKDARAMALSTRKLIELSFLALLDSGIDYRGRNVGCYAAGTAFDILSIAEPDVLEAKGSFAGIPCMIANKISYHLDLQGPSIPIDTACSSSLTAIHLAVQALRAEDCEAAVVGGCQLNLRLADFVQYSQGSVLAPDGKCKPFDANADGFSRGEGAVVVVLKPYNDALRDGDYIYGNILGTGINSTGALAPAYAPVGEAQADAMRRAYRGLGVNPREVDFVEMHATGTAAGDPVECKWVGENFGRDADLLIGSVKGNIGHLEITAFLASLSKICSLFETRVVHPNVNLERLNPAIPWDKYRLKVALEPTHIEARSSSGKLLVSMCSSGIGGANGHVVIESLEPRQIINPKTPVLDTPVLLVAGGLSPRSAGAVAEDLRNSAFAHPDRCVAMSVTAGRRAKQMTWRTFAIANPAQRQSSSFLSFPEPVLSPRHRPPLVFLFSGQGPQHFDMGRQLFKEFPVFRDSVLELDLVHREMTGTSLLVDRGLFADTMPSQSLPTVWPISLILPSLAMVQMAMFDLLCSFGMRPDIVMGHSAGETSMLYASGAGSKVMAMELAIARGRAMEHVEQCHGTMAALACGPVQAQSIIESVRSDVDDGSVLEIACFNSADAVAIAGHITLVDKAVELATTRGILARKIRTRVPVHSSMMEFCKTEYRLFVSEAFTRHPGNYRPHVTTYSTCYGDIIDSFDEEYFWQNTRNPVQFSRTVAVILRRHPTASIVEISPHPSLSLYLQELGASTSSVVCPMRRTKHLNDHHDRITLMNALGQLAILGHNSIDFHALNPSRSVDRIELSSYPFSKKHVPYLPQHSIILDQQLGLRHKPLNHIGLRINQQTHPELAQHVINGEPIMPAAGFLEMALEYGATSLWNVQFHSALSLSAEDPVSVELELNGTHWSVKSLNHTGIRGVPPTKRLHAEGYMSRESVAETGDIDIKAIKDRLELRRIEAFYGSLRHFAQYGAVYSRVIDFYLGPNETLVKVRGAGSDLPSLENFIFHPAILDACLHVAVHPNFTANPDHSIYYLPARVEAMVLHDLLLEGHAFPDILYAHVVLREWLPNEIVTDVYVVDTRGTKLCTVHGLVVQRHQNSISRAITKRLTLVYQSFGSMCRGDFDSGFEKVGLEVERVESDLSSCGDDKIHRRSLSANSTSANELLSNLDVEHSESFVDSEESLAYVVQMSNGQLDHDESRDSSPQMQIIDHLETECQSVLGHLTGLVGKKTLRILQLGSWSKVLTDRICSILESIPSCWCNFVIANNDVNTPSEEPLPSFCWRLSLDLSKAPREQGLSELEGSFDIVIGLDAVPADRWTADQLQNLISFLLPGGFLLLGEYNSWLSEKCGFSCHLDPVLQESGCDVFESCSSTSGALHRRELLTSLGLKAHIIRSANQSLWYILEGQAPSLSLASPLVNSHPQNVVVLPYVLGREMDIQDALKKVNINDVAHVWITTVSDTDAFGARGFSRSLRREFPLWNVGFASFAFPCTVSEQTETIYHLITIPGMELEVVLDENRTVLVPRFHESPAPRKRSMPKLYHAHLLPTHTEIEVEAFSTSEIGAYGLIGRVTRVGNDCNPCLLYSRVIAVVMDAPTDHIMLHEGCVTILRPEADNVQNLVSIAPYLLLGGMALGIGNLQNPSRMRSRRLVVTHCESKVGRTLMWIFAALGFEALGFEKPSLLGFSSLRLGLGDVVVSGCNEDEQLVLSFLSEGTRVFHWNSITNTVLSPSGDPWTVGEVLRIAIDSIQGATLPTFTVSSGSLPVAQEHFLSLFKSDEPYLLVGGIGSLGMHICLWMYQNGARNIIMTSKSGIQSLKRVQDTLALRMLQYLETRSDLSLQLEASDAASLEDMQKLIRKINRPIAGCMLLSGLLADHGFFSQDTTSFAAAFAPKLRAFEALESALDIDKLDFLVVFSSIASFGNAGQTNYASANTVLDGKVEKYKNAFSIVAPAITDTISMVGRLDHDYQVSRYQHLMSWAFSARELCDCIEDGILKLADEPYSLYIPDLDWNLVEKHLGPSGLYSHLVRRESRTRFAPSQEELTQVLRKTIVEFLHVEPNEFSPAVPFTSYGLDSLSAGRLSFALRPLLPISQLQLLGDISLDDIERRMEKQSVKKQRVADALAEVASLGPVELFTWEEVNGTGHDLVKLADYGGVPLILIHGASGSVVSFMPLQQTFKSSLWALQTTAETPMDSLDNMARFYYEKIKAARPEGPYRLGGYSGTSLLLFLLARIFEVNGDQIVQFVVIDHFPLLFLSPVTEPDEETLVMRSPGHAMIRQVLNGMLLLYRADSSPLRHIFADDFEAAADGKEVPAYMNDWYKTFNRVVITAYDFIFRLLPPEEPCSPLSLRNALVEWLGNLRAPVTTVIASGGVVSMIPTAMRGGWDDAGACLVFPDAKVFKLDGNHFEILGLPALAEILETGWEN